MGIGYTECPYCYQETEIDYEGQKQGDLFKETCQHCKKEFAVYFELEIEFYPRRINLEVSDK